MPEISAIEPQKRKRGRFNIFVDGEFAFGLDEATLVRENLKIGQKITEDKIQKLIEENEIGKILDKVYRFLSYRPRSEKEIKDYLKKKNVGLKVEEAVLVRLKKLKLVDDQEFARWWIDSRSKGKPKGKIVLQRELWQKGIEREIAQKLLGKQDELTLAQKAAAKKLKSFKNLPRREFYQKMGAYLVRRGFEWETAKSVIDTLVKNR